MAPVSGCEKTYSDPCFFSLKKIAQALHVSLDELVFEAGERGPSDDLRMHFEAVARMTPEEQQVVRSLLEGMILKHDARRFQSER